MSLSSTTATRLPGEPGIWVFVGADLGVFSTFFVIFALARAAEPATFNASRALLHPIFGIIDTLLLVTSSWLVARAVADARNAECNRGQHKVTIALFFGLCFVVSKVTEWSILVSQGQTPTTNIGFTWYFGLTGIHLLHTIVGMGALLFMRAILGHPQLAERFMHLESAATFWHLIDLLWLMIFALIYLSL